MFVCHEMNCVLARGSITELCRAREEYITTLDFYLFRGDPTSVGEGNETFLIRVWKPLPRIRVLKTMRLTTICNGPKQSIFASSGLELLQMVLETDIGQCETLVGVRLESFHSKHILKP